MSGTIDYCVPITHPASLHFVNTNYIYPLQACVVEEQRKRRVKGFKSFSFDGGLTITLRDTRSSGLEVGDILNSHSL